MPLLTLATTPREIYGYCRLLHTVLRIKTALLHDNVQYKNVQKQSVAYWLFNRCGWKREIGCDAIK